MGDVYHATDVDSGEGPRIKLLHGDATAEELQVRRFLREASTHRRSLAATWCA